MHDLVLSERMIVIRPTPGDDLGERTA